MSRVRSSFTLSSMASALDLEIEAASEGVASSSFSGFEGVVYFYELLKSTQENIIPLLNCRSLFVDVSAGQWDEVHELIAKWMKRRGVL